MHEEFCCQAYSDIAPSVDRLRDFLAGEWIVKGHKEKYLPRLTRQSNDEYDAYRTRTTFLNATARTHQGLLGEVFRKDPKFTMPNGELQEQIQEDADMSGINLYAYCRKVVSEVLAVGRGGTLVDYNKDENRPYLAFYRREDIINWRYSRVGGKTILSMLILYEPATVDAEDTGKEYLPHASQPGDKFEPTNLQSEDAERIRVLFLDPDNNNQLTVHIYERHEHLKGRGKNKAKSYTWELAEEARVPVRNGKPLGEIPWVWHEPEMNGDEMPRPPLDDLVSLNLNHYLLSADHNHGLRYSTLPTPYAIGFGEGPFTIGSSEAWITDNVQAKAGYLEASGAGLEGLEKKLVRLEQSMAALGARLLETQKREAESADALALRQSGETSVLSGLAAAISNSLTRALQWVFWWGGGGADDFPDSETVNVELNTDFISGKLKGDEVVAFVQGWIQGGYSYDTLFELLKRGEVVPPNRTKDQEIKLIEDESVVMKPPGMQLEEENPDDEEEEEEGEES